MIEYFKNIKGVKIYTDEYMEEDKIIRGIKGNTIYFVANPKTGNYWYAEYKKYLRVKKLERILNGID